MSRVSKKLIEAVSKSIHEYIAFSTLSTFYTMKKVYGDTNEKVSPEEQAKAIDLLAKMISSSECLYEDLTAEQKELMKTLALDLIHLVNSETKRKK